MWSDLSEVCRPPMRLKHLAEGTATANNNNTVTPRPPAIKSRYVWTSHYKAAWLQPASIICSPSASSDWTAGFLSLAITHHVSGLFCLVFNQAMEFKSSKQDLERPHRERERKTSADVLCWSCNWVDFFTIVVTQKSPGTELSRISC